MKWLLVAMYVAKMADVGTTEMGLRRGGVHELNPLMKSRPVMYVGAVVLPGAVYKLSGAIKNKKVRIAWCVAAVALWSYAAYHNYRFAERSAAPENDPAVSGQRARRGFRLQFTVRF